MERGDGVLGDLLGAPLLLVEHRDEVRGVALRQRHAVLVQLALPHLRQEVALGGGGAGGRGIRFRQMENQ